MTRLENRLSPIINGAGEDARYIFIADGVVDWETTWKTGAVLLFVRRVQQEVTLLHSPSGVGGVEGITCTCPLRMRAMSMVLCN